jgi:hypothetical protein
MWVKKVFGDDETREKWIHRMIVGIHILLLLFILFLIML